MRIDPLTGHRVIISGAGLPDGGLPGPPSGATAPLSDPILVPEGEGPTAQPLLGVRANRDADLFWSAPAAGAHERLPDPDVDRLPEVLDVWRERMRVHAQAACRHAVAGPEGAALYALPFVPAEIARERERFGAYTTRTMGGNLIADLVQEEVRRRERVVAIDDEAVLVCAFAGRAPYQLMLAPRSSRPRFEDDGPTGAALLADGLARLERHLGFRPGVHLWIRTAPHGAERFGWRIDVLPVLLAPGGLELGAGLPVNPVAPEAAAAALRAA